MSSLYTAPCLNILTSRGITNRHFNCYINAPIHILLGSSVTNFSRGPMPHNSEIA